MLRWWQKFTKESIFFISPDVKRAIGVEDILPNYHIICSYFDSLIPILRKEEAKIFCLEEHLGEEALKFNNSAKLFEQQLVRDYLKKHSLNPPWIIYFKPSIKLDLEIEKRGFLPVGNNSYLNKQFENKIDFFNLGKKAFPKNIVPSKIGRLEEFTFPKLAKEFDLPFVVQFGHGWAGKTTFFIKREKEFINLAKRFTKTRVKISRKINGFTVLNNGCIYQDSLFVGPPAIQLSGIPMLHPRESVTCGRQWPVPLLLKEQIKTIYHLSQTIGRVMEKRGFRGFFGLDFLVEKKSGKVYLSEINARLTASAPFYTRLEREGGRIPLFAYHLGAFLGKSFPKEKYSPEIVGSQVIFRLPLQEKFLLSFPPFGILKRKNGYCLSPNQSYQPEKLKLDEFILINNLSARKKTTEGELARIETKMEVLKTPGRLKWWLTSLILGKKKKLGPNQLINHKERGYPQ